MLFLYRLKDGKRYPWSSEDTSSLILYPEAANQTIYARRASKIDEGMYTCVLRNATHTMEHHIELKVKSSSPDIPLPTFKPTDQFVVIDGTARFYCEAFVGKKDLPDIAISIRWYHLTDDNNIQAIDDDGKEEVVKREDEQIIGSYLTISGVTSNHYGRYLCRIEMGNSNKHRLEMSAALINAWLIRQKKSFANLTNPIFLGVSLSFIMAVILTVMLILKKYMGKTSAKKKAALKMHRELAVLALFHHQNHHHRSRPQSISNSHNRNKYDNIKIQIRNT